MLDYQRLLAELAEELAQEGEMHGRQRMAAPVVAREELYEALGFMRGLEHASRRILDTLKEHYGPPG